MTAQYFKNIALFSYFALMATLIAWIILGTHSENFPTAAMLIFALVPLLFPLRGLLHGKPYTHAWTGFLMLFYFSHGIGELYSTQGSIFYPSLEILFSCSTFIASIIFIKSDAKIRAKLANSD